MKILVLTPDTDIDRRIILQVNSLVKEGFEVTIIGVPYSGENLLSGNIHSNIKVKRIDLNHLEYHSTLIKLYKLFHKKIMNFAHKRNDFLNNYANNNLVQGENSNWWGRIKNKFVTFTTKMMNSISTYLIRFFQKSVNLSYNTVLKIFRILDINFFPIFDKAFYEAGSKEDADIIVANDLPSLKASHSLAKEKKIPLIYDAHENYTEQCTLPKRYAKLLEVTEAEILPDVDFWIVPNELLGKSMIEKYKEKYQVDIKDPLVIQNAVKKWGDYIDYQECNLLREKIKVEKDKKILLYQGGMIPKRNLENLVRSMKYVLNENVVLVMLGFGNYADVLKKIAKKNKVNHKVFFLDPVSQNQLLKYTCSADVGIIPYPAVDNNTYYCSPNKLYEFIQARLPILANDLPFLRKVIVGQNIGTVQDFSNSRLIAKAIDSIFSEEHRIKEYKVSIHQVAEKMNWELEEEKLVEQYVTLKNSQKAV